MPSFFSAGISSINEFLGFDRKWSGRLLVCMSQHWSRALPRQGISRFDHPAGMIHMKLCNSSSFAFTCGTKRRGRMQYRTRTRYGFVCPQSSHHQQRLGLRVRTLPAIPFEPPALRSSLDNELVRFERDVLIHLPCRRSSLSMPRSTSAGCSIFPAAPYTFIADVSISQRLIGAEVRTNVQVARFLLCSSQLPNQYFSNPPLAQASSCDF